MHLLDSQARLARRGRCFSTIRHAIERQADTTAGIIATGALVGGISAFLGNAALQRNTTGDALDKDE